MISTQPVHHGLFAEEYRIWNTPVLGAFLFWIFAHSYVKNRDDRNPPSVIHFFILAGILDSKRILPYVKSSLKLRTMISNVNRAKDSDLIDTLQKHVQSRLEYTSDAIDIAVGAGLLAWDIDRARLRPNVVKTPRGFHKFRESAYLHELELLFSRLGKWFAEITDLPQLVTLLKIRL